jgi:hypothetical protein
MNKASMTENYKRLLKYRNKNAEPKKLTCVLPASYHELLERIIILEGISKTELVKRALDHYSDYFGGDVLFPATDPM